jgi:hypothetical protein
MIDCDSVSDDAGARDLGSNDGTFFERQALLANELGESLAHPLYLLPHGRPASASGPTMVAGSIHPVLLDEWIVAHLGRDLPRVESDPAMTAQKVTKDQMGRPPGDAIPPPQENQ